jgi:hypothetical protein
MPPQRCNARGPDHEETDLMATQHHPITVPAGRRQVGLDPQPTKPPNLNLLHGWWVASCPSCGFTLAENRRQDRCERRAARRACPVCAEA